MFRAFCLDQLIENGRDGAGEVYISAIFDISSLSFLQALAPGNFVEFDIHEGPLSSFVGASNSPEGLTTISLPLASNFSAHLNIRVRLDWGAVKRSFWCSPVHLLGFQFCL